MTKRTIASAVILLAALALSVSPAQGAPLYQMRVDGSGVPVILASTTGYSGGQLDGGTLTVTSDGYVVVKESPSSAHEFQVLNPALASANNAPSNSNVALIQFWASSGGAPGGGQLYDGSVPGATKVLDDNIGLKGLTRALPGDTFFGWTGGGTISYTEVQLQDGAGSYDADSGTAARLASGSAGIQTGLHKQGLEVWESAGSADTWRVLGGMASNGGIVKMEWGPLTGQTATAAGTRAITGGTRWLIGGSGNSRTSLIADLVPGISDTMVEMAYNPYDGNLYILSAGGNQVFLSAITFTWDNTSTADTAASYVDLDPSSVNNYIELTYDSALNPNDGAASPDLLAGSGLGFNSTGSVLYVSRGTRVFIFDVAAVPEPATLGLLVIGGLGAMVARRRRR